MAPKNRDVVSKASGPKPKAKGKKKSTRKQSGPSRRIHPVDAKMVRGCANPFSHDAEGCRLLSGTSTKSFTMDSTGRSGFSADANGHGAFWITPAVYGQRAGTASITAGAVTFAATSNIPEATQLNTFTGHYRVVCAGIRVFSSVNLDAAKGLVQVAAVAQSSTQVPPAAGLYQIDSVQYERFDDGPLYGFDRTYLFPRESAAHIANFELIGSAHTGWVPLVISCTGATAGATVYVEWITHLEFQPLLNTIGARLAESAQDPRPHVNDAVTAIVQKVPFGVETESWESTLAGYIKEALSTVAEVGIGMLMA